ncbi:hypothetical protein A2U01_0084586, partial [Trifolium medium]|nr:hypothetical protein [Trifolium medium]
MRVSVICASRREDGASRQSDRKMHQEGSAVGASRSFIWRVAHL